MTPRFKTRAAVAAGILALAFLGANAWLVWNVDAAASAGRPPAATLWLLGLAGAPVVGTIIAGRRPGHPYGCLLLSFGITSSLLELTELYALYAMQTYGQAGTAAVVGGLVSQTLWGATIGHIPLLLLLFPDGSPPTPRWRWLAQTIVVLTVSGSAVALFTPGELGVVPVPNPIGASGALATLVDGFVITTIATLFATMLPAAASLFLRRRSASQLQRLQLRWFSWSAAVLAGALLVSATGVIRDEIAANFILMIALMSLFAAVGIAVLRYRLYDIDRLVSRTVSWALVTVVLAAVYLGAVTLLSALTAATLASGSPVAVAGATLLAAAAFKPARTHIQAAVDRRFNRARYDAARMTESYRARLRDQLELESISHDLVGTAREALHPRAALLWLREDGVAP